MERLWDWHESLNLSLHSDINHQGPAPTCKGIATISLNVIYWKQQLINNRHQNKPISQNMSSKWSKFYYSHFRGRNRALEKPCHRPGGDGFEDVVWSHAPLVYLANSCNPIHPLFFQPGTREIVRPISCASSRCWCYRFERHKNRGSVIRDQFG